MSNNSQLAKCPSFTPFPRLPAELRLKIWADVHSLTPPQLLPFSLRKSDLDYLRLRRKACHDYQHIFARRMKTVPPILHVCRESRSVGLQHYSLGFDTDRILALGRGDTDGHTYTTCSHEVAMGKQDIGIYWDRTKDVVFLASDQWLDEKSSAYVWGGKTGVRFGRMRSVAMTYDTFISNAIGQNIQWESLDLIFILVLENFGGDNVAGRQVGSNSKINDEGYIQLMLRAGGLLSSKGNPVEVKFKSLDKLVVEATRI